MLNDHRLPGERTSPSRLGLERSSASYDTVVVLSGIVSAGLALVYWALRIGFDNPTAPIVRAVALALFTGAFPQACSSILQRNDPDTSGAGRWWKSYPLLWLLCIGFTAGLGRVSESWTLDPFPPIAFLGAASFVAICFRWVRGAAFWRTTVLVVGAVAFSAWASGVVWGRVYKNPLFYENYILDGKVHHDTLFLSSFANMLRTYHAASIGIDGLNYVPYHWGTMWLFANWSNLIGSHVLDFYQLGYPVTMIPFFFGGTLAFAVAMRNRRVSADAQQDLREDFRFWFLFLAACIGIIPITGLDAMGVWTSNLLISESYAVAVPCALLFLATVATFYQNVARNRTAGQRRPSSVADALFVPLGIPLALVALGYLKISAMVLAFALAIYFLIRLRLYRRPAYLAGSIVSTALVFVTYAQVSLPAHREGFAPLDFLWSFVKPAWWPFFLIVHLFWSWLYIFVRLRAEGIGTLADLKEAAAEHRILDVEAVALIAILGLAPGFLIRIDGGSAFYFSDMQRWLAVGLLLSHVPMVAAVIVGESPQPRPRKFLKLLNRLDAVTVRSLLLGFLLLPVIASMASNAVVWPLALARANADTRLALYPVSMSATIPLGLHGLPYLHDQVILDRGLRAAPNFAVAGGLRRLSGLPLSTRRHTAVFIAQNQIEFWKSLTRPGACTFQSFVATALTSMAMVDGMPPYGCVLSRYYGIGSFTPRQRPQNAADLTSSALCQRAAAARLDRVLAITFDGRSPARTTAVQCQPLQ